MIDVADLVRRRGGRAVVDGVSLMVEAGEIVGLIGLNGAGKTTLIDCIAGLARPDAGLVSVAGHVPGSLAARRATGVLLQQPGLPARLTVAETLALFAGLHEVAVDTRLAAALGLDALAGCRVDRLSGGQEQRLALALALQSGAPALVLDEPATALDPLMRRDLAALLGERRAAGAAILLATHDLAEASSLCDRVVLLHQGRLVAQGRPADLISATAATLADVVLAIPREPGQ
jgi:ABC-type multidrug transport system ATPase subunit